MARQDVGIPVAGIIGQMECDYMLLHSIVSAHNILAIGHKGMTCVQTEAQERMLVLLVDSGHMLVTASKHSAGVGDKVLNSQPELELLAELQEILQRLVDLAEYPVFPLDGYIIAEEAIVAAAVAGVHDSNGTAHSNSFLYPPFCFFHNSGPVAFIQGGDIIQHLVFPGQVIGVYGKACFLEGFSCLCKLFYRSVKDAILSMSLDSVET